MSDITSALPMRSRDFEVSEVEDGYVVFDETSQRVHYLNATAALVYEFADGTRTVEDIAGLVSAVFEQSSPATAEVHDALEMLRREQLVS